jgi:hypothetical protein
MPTDRRHRRRPPDRGRGLAGADRLRRLPRGVRPRAGAGAVRHQSPPHDRTRGPALGNRRGGAHRGQPRRPSHGGLAGIGEPDEWDTAQDVARHGLAWLLRFGEPGRVLNLNAPNVPPDQLRGIRPARLAAFGAVQADIGEAGAGYLTLTFSEIHAERDKDTDAPCSWTGGSPRRSSGHRARTTAWSSPNFAEQGLCRRAERAGRG